MHQHILNKFWNFLFKNLLLKKYPTKGFLSKIIFFKRLCYCLAVVTSVTVHAQTPAPVVNKKFPSVVTKLITEDLQVGRGRPVHPKAKLVVHYTSWLYDSTQPLGRGPQFESTLGKAPYKFQLDDPEHVHIKGWEIGFANMRVGGKRRLIIPPGLAYGSNGAGQTIPPDATLLYEVELLGID